MAACTLAGWLMLPSFELANIAMVYVLGVVIVATRFGRGPSLVTTLLGVALFDYLFVPPRLAFMTREPRYLVMFAFMVATGLIVGSLTERLRVETVTSARLSAQVDFERQRSSLLSSVSHDFRTPLATVTAATGALLDTDTPLDTDTSKQLLNAILHESTRIARMIDNLLQMTRLDAKHIQPNLHNQYLEEPIGAAAGRFASDLASGRIQLNLPDDLPMCRFDNDLVEIVLVNLIENALKYSDASNPVEIEARVCARVVRVDVLDRGSGIPSAERVGLFEKFHRLSNARSKRGFGLGLAICRAAMQAQGGHVDSEPRAGGGSTFYLELPIVQEIV